MPKRVGGKGENFVEKGEKKREKKRKWGARHIPAGEGGTFVFEKRAMLPLRKDRETIGKGL